MPPSLPPGPPAPAHFQAAPFPFQENAVQLDVSIGCDGQKFFVFQLPWDQIDKVDRSTGAGLQFAVDFHTLEAIKAHSLRMNSMDFGSTPAVVTNKPAWMK